MWALFFKHLHVHPNVVTILSMVIGIMAGVMFYYTDPVHNIIGVLLLIGEEFLTVLPAMCGSLQFILR